MSCEINEAARNIANGLFALSLGINFFLLLVLFKYRDQVFSLRASIQDLRAANKRLRNGDWL